MPIKKAKSARFQVDQVGDNEDVIIDENYALTAKGESVHCTYLHHKSLRHYLTREVLPSEHNYRNLLSFGRNSLRRQLRPTMEELREEGVSKPLQLDDTESRLNDKKQENVVKLGWINGVYVSKTLSKHFLQTFLLSDALPAKYLGCDVVLEAYLGHGTVWDR